MCANGSCIVVNMDGGTVNVTDSKLGEASPVLTVSPDQWVTFLGAAVNWNRTTTIRAGGLRLMNTQGVETDLPVCICAASSVAADTHLHFDWKEWDTFVDGALRGKFTGEALAA